MAEEILEQTEDGVDVQKYIDKINEIKNNTVSKAEYEKLKAENNTLFEAAMKGPALGTSTEVPKPTAQELINKLYGTDCSKLSDLEYVEGVCDLRDVLLETHGIDYMVPTGTQYQADYNDKASANKVYEGFRHCIEIADGDNAIFLQELGRITNDTAIINKLRNRR